MRSRKECLVWVAPMTRTDEIVTGFVELRPIYNLMSTRSGLRPWNLPHQLGLPLLCLLKRLLYSFTDFFFPLFEVRRVYRLA